ncbi:HNH endonuclease signature motif containing protein [Microbacterium sp. LWH3-1.2]|uniref:HNH endonuclease signature motif containing protein n=1 Tax=Microbacterium sp. LWH3-1.2 TaxID=3135256 RepID=UPI00343C3A03
MTNLSDALTGLGDALAEVVAAAFAEGCLAAETDAGVLAALAAAGRLHRLAEAAMTAAVAEIVDRDDAVPRPDQITTRYGCRKVGELVERATRVSGRTAAEIVKAARATGRRTSLSTGEALPAEYPQLRRVLAAGQVGVDGVVAVVGAFRSSVGRADLLAADDELAAAARGEGADAAPPASADELRALAQVWAAYLDQDGAEPAEAKAMRRRGITLGRRGEDGLVPIGGRLLPEVAEQLQLGFDSVLNPKVDGVSMPKGPCFTGIDRDADAVGDVGLDRSEGEGAEGSEGGEFAGEERVRDQVRREFADEEPVEAAADQRSLPQQRHDALAMILGVAAASGALPTLGGAAPTLVVHVREEDLATGRGCAYLPGQDDPIPLAAARHIACTGAVQRVVLTENGRIVSIEILDRVFNHHQRKAITLRDGECIIPGCHVRPEWCEIHHVEEHSRGGPTHTDNGVLLCWWHHRTLDTGGWQIRMVDGSPYVKGPYWWDAQVKWRPVTKSTTRRRDHIAARI